MVIGFSEHSNGTTQSNLHVRWLKVAMSEVCREFKVSLDIRWLCFNYPTTFQFQANTKEVLPS